ncbi:hypothetical protein NA78x_003467 [Anatilimnocola sp. NA78]|uniref:hypothetical protein n=1 Tax=Anatilimnocola sp. NA78 TaxID=3415683 RepID=UPI003CE4FFE2
MSRKLQTPYSLGGNPIGMSFLRTVQDANGICVGKFHRIDQALLFIAASDLLAACHAVLEGRPDAEEVVRAAVAKVNQLGTGLQDSVN